MKVAVRSARCQAAMLTRKAASSFLRIGFCYPSSRSAYARRIFSKV